MAHMVRKQIYIPTRQYTLLKQLAKLRGVSEAEIIRQAIDREATGGVGPMRGVDTTALEALIQFALSNPSLAGAAYQWQRTDAYEDRLAGYPGADLNPAASSPRV